MDKLTGTEKRWLEKAFEMQDGYVLNFTNPSFERFFNNYGVDIYDDRFAIYGTSKANRLRAFWDTESDIVVGRILLGMLDSCDSLDSDSIEVRKRTEIAAKLSDMSIDKSDISARQIRSQEVIAISEEKNLERLWGPAPLRVFISHISCHKEHATKIKESLAEIGIASFVAHTDIEPTKEWQTQIELALASMDSFVALLTRGFKESNWTDQEVGFALARRVPILPVSRGIDPYGFIAKIQALKWSEGGANPVALKVMEMALQHNELSFFAKDAFIEAVSGATSENWANTLSNVLSRIDSFTPDQAERFVIAFNSNRQIQEGIGFKEKIISELKRLTGRLYYVHETGKLYPFQGSQVILF